MTRLSLDAITIADRHRHDLGDIKGLAESMTEVGQLQPVVVTPEHRLVAGQRRLVAARSLGWTEIEVVVVDNLTDAASLLRAEADENVCRKDFTPTEAESIAAAREAVLKPLAKQRMSDGGKGAQLPQPSMRSDEAAATGTGYSPTTLRKVREVKQIAADEMRPEPVRQAATQALADMDRSGKVDPAHKAVKRAEIEHSPVSEYLTGDPTAADRAYVKEYDTALGRAMRVVSYDAERLGPLLTDAEVETLRMHLQALGRFLAAVERARSGLRVVSGGRK